MAPSPLVWLFPCFVTLFLYGVGQGLVKKWIGDVPPARFCLYFILAKSIVNLSFFLTQEHPDPFTPAGRPVMILVMISSLLDGTGWILYFQSILFGPITIVGTLSAAYPALTVLFARVFLAEVLTPIQYAGVALVIISCLGLSYAPPDPQSRVTHKRWIPLASMALLCWGASQTILKHAYTLPNAHEANFALFGMVGGMLTLGVYGVIGSRGGGLSSLKEFVHSFLPMGMMAAGDLGVVIAASTGPISIVTPLTGAYPVVTLGFAALILREKITRLQWLCIVTLLLGIFLVPGYSSDTGDVEVAPSPSMEQPLVSPTVP